jgi:hypothetical protein
MSYLLFGKQPDHVAVDEAEGCGTIQLRVAVYRNNKCDVSAVMACSGASRSAGFCVKHTIAAGEFRPRLSSSMLQGGLSSPCQA